MRLFILEIKRVLKTPMTIIMLVAALLLSFALAYIPVTFEYVAKEYMEEQEISTKEEIEKVVQGFKMINKDGIKGTNCNLFINIMIKVIIFNALALIF